MIKNPKIGDLVYAIDKWHDWKAVYLIFINDIVDNKIVDCSYEAEYNIEDCYDNLDDAIEELLKYQQEVIYI